MVATLCLSRIDEIRFRPHFKRDIRMNCYSCALESRKQSAIAICLECGAALCLDHKRESDSYRVGGMRLGCAHHDLANTLQKAKA